MSRLTANDGRVVSASTASRLRDMERALGTEDLGGLLGARAKQRAKRLAARPRSTKDMTSEEIAGGLGSLEHELVIESFRRDKGRVPTADELTEGIEYLSSLQGSAEVMRELARNFLARGDNDNAARALALAEDYQKAIDQGYEDFSSYCAKFPPPGTPPDPAQTDAPAVGAASRHFSAIRPPEPEDLDE